MNEFAAAWLAALRSGKYQQARGMLRSGDRYCALGVACDLYLQTYGASEWAQFGANLYDFRWKGKSPRGKAEVPEAVRAALGMTPRGLVRVVTLNDTRKLPFSAIADFLESDAPSWIEAQG